MTYDSELAKTLVSVVEPFDGPNQKNGQEPATSHVTILRSLTQDDLDFTDVTYERHEYERTRVSRRLIGGPVRYVSATVSATIKPAVYAVLAQHGLIYREGDGLKSRWGAYLNVDYTFSGCATADRKDERRSEVMRKLEQRVADGELHTQLVSRLNEEIEGCARSLRRNYVDEQVRALSTRVSEKWFEEHGETGTIQTEIVTLREQVNELRKRLGEKERLLQKIKCDTLLAYLREKQWCTENGHTLPAEVVEQVTKNLEQQKAYADSPRFVFPRASQSEE